MIETSLAGHAAGGAYVIEQGLEWRGPIEWAAPQGRLVLREQRRTTVRVYDDCMLIDMACEVSAAAHDVAIGPTRHAWFNFRVAPSMCVDEGGLLLDDRGHAGCAEGIAAHAAWVACSGPTGGGRSAGIALAPVAAPGAAPWWWFVSDWGVVTASPCRDRAIELASGASTLLAARFVVFDGSADTERLRALLAGNA